MSKLLIFDLDDCLAPTNNALQFAIDEIYPAAFGMTAEEILPIQEVIYKETGCVVTYFSQQLGKDAAWVEDIYHKFAALAATHLKEHVPICSERGKLLQELKNQGWTLAIVTQGVRNHALAVLQHMGLRDFFEDDLILGRDSTPGFTKRTPEPFLEVQRRLNFVPEVKIMLEDSFINLKAPRALDFKTGLIAPEPRTDADWLTYQATNVNDIIRQILAAHA